MPVSRFTQLAVEDYRLPGSWARRLSSPALIVYLDRVRENLRRTLSLVEDPARWRPHLKTTKIPEVYAELVRAGLRHFKCATVREARVVTTVLGREGVTDGDVLLAHPLVGPNMQRLNRLARENPNVRFSVLCEDPDGVDLVDGCIRIFVDVNPGMHRTGIPALEIDRIRSVARRAGGRFQGLHFYDGHVTESSAEGRRISAWRGYKTLVGLVEDLNTTVHVNEVVTSGTPSFRYALDFEPFQGLAATHRVSPGTVVFHDLRTEQELDDLDLLPAALVFTRVVSHPREGHFTCDAGSKSIAAEAGDPCAFVLGHPAAEALTPSEEHLPFSVAGNRPSRGEELYLVPRHVCPTVNLAEQALLVDGETISITRVEARAHDLLLDCP